MISDLQKLIHPLTEAEFLTLLRERKLTYLPGSDSRRFESLAQLDYVRPLQPFGRASV
jgi:hypothetical protein